MAALHHPGVLRWFASGVLQEAQESCQYDYPAGTPYNILELVRGRSLRSCCGFLDWPTIRCLLRQLLDALAYVHRQGVLHLDIKPGNLLVESATGRLKLCDFGIAQRIQARQAPRGESPTGTLAYMSPEQLRCAWPEYGPWTDAYSVGALAYALATGVPPFRGTCLEVAEAHIHHAPPRLAACAPVPPGFEAWARSLLRKQPEHRLGIEAAAQRLAALPASAAPWGT